MVNKFSSLAGSAVLTALYLSGLLSAASAQTVSAQSDTGSGKAVFMKKSGVVLPSSGAGITMYKSETESLPVLKQAKSELVNKTAKEVISRSQKFVYHFSKPENGSGETIVLLHGSGGDEASLVPFARKVWPRATLLGMRGRILQEGRTRWYARITPVKFDQQDVRKEADAFVRFLTRLSDQDRIDLSHTTFVGYSNGANLLAATMVLHPDMVKKAVLMRSMPVLDQTPPANLSKAKVLVVTGQDDKTYAPFAPALSDLLRSNGARVDARMVKANHMIGDKDVALVTAWLSGQGPDGAAAFSQATSAENTGHNDRRKIVPDTEVPE